MEEAGPSHGPRGKCTESLLNLEGAPAALDPSLRDSSRLVICLAECVACRLSESVAVHIMSLSFGFNCTCFSLSVLDLQTLR